MRRALALFLILAATTGAPALGQDSRATEPQQELERLEQERVAREARMQALVRNADEAAREVVRLRQRLIEAAAERDRLEREVERSQRRLRDLRREAAAADAQMARDRVSLENVVVALIAVERDRPPALAIQPDDAAEAARAAILMGQIAPQLEARTRQMAERVASLRRVRQDILMQNTAFRDSTIRLAASRATVGRLIEDRRELERRLRRDAVVEQTRLQAIAARAQDLRDLIERLGAALPSLGGAAREGPAFGANFEQLRGRLPRPAGGPVVAAFGSRLDAGGRSTGVTFRTRRGAQVLASANGRIEFAGPFRSYGRILIVNVGAGHHIVLAGLGRTLVDAGQEVLAGEPVGEMPDDDAVIPDLYMEIREDGRPLDPSPWLRPLDEAAVRTDDGAN